MPVCHQPLPVIVCQLTLFLHKCHAVLLRWESSSLILWAIHHARLLLSQALLHLHAALHAAYPNLSLTMHASAAHTVLLTDTLVLPLRLT